MSVTKQSLKVRMKEAIDSFLFSGNIILLIFGIVFSIWLNNLFATPITVLLISSLPFSITSIQNIIVPFFIFAMAACIIFIFFKKVFRLHANPLWFFCGASLTSFIYAWFSLQEISVVWFENNGWALPDFYFESPMPAIYTYKLFKSIFFASLFGLLGNWNQLFRRIKNEPKKE